MSICYFKTTFQSGLNVIATLVERVSLQCPVDQIQQQHARWAVWRSKNVPYVTFFAIPNIAFNITAE